MERVREGERFMEVKSEFISVWVCEFRFRGWNEVVDAVIILKVGI